MRALLVVWCLVGASPVALAAEMERPKLEVGESLYTLRPFTAEDTVPHHGVYRFSAEGAGGGHRDGSHLR